MRKFTANYSNTNHNFVIQNLLGNKVSNEYLPAICIVKNIIQRGCPTKPSQYLQSKFGETHKADLQALISNTVPKWERIIRGDSKNNYNPAQQFFDIQIPKYFVDYPFIQQLIVPEVPINEITQIEVLEFAGQQVDFYFPQAFLVIEIDGSQHDAAKDIHRDNHLTKFGIKTIRISTTELESENESFHQKISLIQERIKQISRLQEEKKEKHRNFISFSDYQNALEKNAGYNTPVCLATSTIRFQLLILELLEAGKLTFTQEWSFALFCQDQQEFEEIACNDLLLWFEHLFKLQKTLFTKPKVKAIRVNSFQELQSSTENIKVDFSLSKRYTDEFQNNSEIIFVRTDYFDCYRYYKNSNSVTPEYVGLEPYNYFQISTSELVNYHFQFSGENDDETALCFFLKNIYGYDNFNQGQLPIITNALSRNDTIGLLPTGGGKSICYQLATLLQPAISFVVCPIKSLMYDQKQDLDSIYFSRVSHITSDDDGEDKEKIMKEFAQGKYFFIFISPERFQVKSFRQYLLAVNQNYSIAYAVIDEVHCLSEWGHDFRTSYLNLSNAIKKHCNNFRFIALTATASLNVLKDVKLELNAKDESVKTPTDYTRKELEFNVLNDGNNKYNAITEILNDLHAENGVLTPNGDDSKCGIIFTSTVKGAKGCYKVSSSLEQQYRTPVKFYSGKVPVVNQQAIMGSTEFENYKKQVQLDFKENKFTLLAATKAFGMGVNKGNIHYTIHYGIPGSMESLYQEAGRAGRDKKKFSATNAKCIVLFTKTTDEDLLQTVWDRKSTLTQINDVLPKLDGDINTNLFLFTGGQETIKKEFQLIKLILDKYAESGRKSIRVTCEELRALNTDTNLKITKANTEKAIYRLSQLGIIEDWTIENFFRGEFAVDFGSFSERTIVENIQRTINKYDKEFSLEALSTNDLYHAYALTWNKDVPVIHKCIVLLLQWAYDHFAYNRRQSLKDLYELCSYAVNKQYSNGQEFTKEDFKKSIESYFRFNETTYILQHIAENPGDFTKWFEVFYQVEDNQISNKLINWEQQQSLLNNLNRVLESYQFNTGLDFVSGTLRLLIDDFSNIDGKDRFESSFKQIMKYKESDCEYIINNLLLIGSHMSEKSKRDLAATLLTLFPGNDKILMKIQNALGDEYTTDLLLKQFNKRLIKVNQEIHGRLIQIK
jgi:ATP-dependent DNA helicase RecQ